MNHLVRLFADIVLHRRGPADVPANRGVLGACLVAYLLTGAITLAPGSGSAEEVVAQLVADLVIVLVLFGGLLLVTGRRHRVRQTLTALFGTGALLSALSVPFIWMTAEAVQSGGQPGAVAVVGSTALLVLLVASLMVTGHIVRSAMNWPYAGGLLFAIVYFGVSLEVFRRLFPEAG